ncbi:MAG: hypothetical protein A3D24_01650 [Candidatus Blackburnbacteria bacterium RIFCSPHIGHO2_02_FULL_39_13]|uniref:Uncharacterized protein n=1 Tax=Candidatus Blackburnbacteria bacterium RIFCSPLOWO2_01_FULL_40_20 TaxID=1797519 RepID=A0A1G1VBV6_9BACT|nr:MAG: hypothetical protein A2694_01800 [Candidatus Blackburnbacteria bacterium RIFCSPHIGHO2_01_FULL_40_17]OGY10052.1 MAG: hypothetical protein A3D24_01650 [Candidatus Blackburnbacteria bacterium RIFCSPHIGHO2_02_FULL_39_13]OGY12865.1 MAG: hypothetical protein A3A77_03200 [Candidatus Blackburnbacteria bacterium RIFCSPLOWO2_01_FULL_40_20]
MGILGVVLFIVGFLLLFRPVIEWSVRFKNSTQGIQTKVSPATIWTYRIIAIIFILIGFFFSLTFFSIK